MKPTIGNFDRACVRDVTHHSVRFAPLLLSLTLLLWLVPPLAAQSAAHMWAAQTGPDIVSLAWDSIPGATEYRIYLGAPAGQAPVQKLSGRTRRAIIIGVQRLLPGAYLVAVDASGHTFQAPFNQITPATEFLPAVAPGSASAQVTSPRQITVSWNAVPGATAYYIGRTVAGSGFRPLCELCSTDSTYVDNSVMPGLTYGYTIAAIFPIGTSFRVSSNSVTPTSPSMVSAVTSTATTIATTVATNTFGTSATSPITQTVSTIAGNVGGVTTPVNPVTGLTATVTGPGAVRLSWQPSTSTGVTDYIVNRRINGGAWNQVNTNNASTLVYSDVFFPVTLFAQGPVNVGYSVVASKSGAYSAAATTPDVIVQPTSNSQSTTIACKLDYMRADNMWAAFGRPDGLLGTESISLASQQDKVFATDWAYEKQRNDGTNYYGSHLRIATNSSSHTIRLQLRTLTLTGLVVWARTGTDSFWIRLAPNTTTQFQADLMEVFCE